MNINVNRIPTIAIGYLGENIVTKITFNYSQWNAVYGEGTLTLIFKRNGDTLAYPVFLDHEIGTYESTWIVTNTDVAKVGEAEAQLVYSVNGEAIKKSEIFTVNVKNSLENGETPPDPYQSWLDNVYEVADEMAQTKESMIEYVDDKQSEINHSVELAEEYKNSASNSASEAGGYATSANLSANAASESAETAGRYADSAQASAEQAEQSVLMGGYINADIVDGHLIITYVNIDNLEFSLVDGRLMVSYGD